jgi:hypothetical protein
MTVLLSNVIAPYRMVGHPIVLPVQLLSALLYYPRWLRLLRAEANLALLPRQRADVWLRPAALLLIALVSHPRWSGLPRLAASVPGCGLLRWSGYCAMRATALWRFGGASVRGDAQVDGNVNGNRRRGYRRRLMSGVAL